MWLVQLVLIVGWDLIAEQNRVEQPWHSTGAGGIQAHWLVAVLEHSWPRARDVRAPQARIAGRPVFSGVAARPDEGELVNSTATVRGGPL